MQPDEHFMREAIRVGCEKGSDPSLNPIGCVIVMQGKILAARRNKVSEHRDAVVGDRILFRRLSRVRQVAGRAAMAHPRGGGDAA